jgi:protein TonB
LTAATYSERLNGDRASPQRRAASFLLAVAIEVLLLLAFFTLNFRDEKKPIFEGGRLTTFDVSSESEADRSAAPKQDERPQTVQTRPPPRPFPPAIKPVIELPPRPLQMIELSREEYLSSDIARLGSNAPGYARSAERGGGGGAGDSQLVGNAPNGQPLYAAEWYREPTQTELAAYMPKSGVQGGGWGLIACKTAPRYRVEDCVELGSSPGSRLAGAARQAAWQFLVRPPRIGGKPQIGEWVRIRIVITDGSAESGS